MNVTLCPIPSYSIFTREFCPWPYAHVLSPLTVYMQTRSVLFSLFMVIFWEVIETNEVAALGASGEKKLLNEGLGCRALQETMDDSLIGDFWMGVAGILLGVLIVWSSDAPRFILLRSWGWMVLELLLLLVPNFFFGHDTGGWFIAIYVRPLVVVVVELLAMYILHDNPSFETFVLWITVELNFVALSFLKIGTFYNNTFLSIGTSIAFIVGCSYILNVEQRRDYRQYRRRSGAIFGFTLLCEEDSERREREREHATIKSKEY